jgi:hypothetical protein
LGCRTLRFHFICEGAPVEHHTYTEPQKQFLFIRRSFIAIGRCLIWIERLIRWKPTGDPAMAQLDSGPLCSGPPTGKELLPYNYNLTTHQTQIRQSLVKVFLFFSSFFYLPYFFFQSPHYSLDPCVPNWPNTATVLYAPDLTSKPKINTFGFWVQLRVCRRITSLWLLVGS